MARTGRPRSFDEAQAVEAAKDVFWRHGLAATSMRDLKDRLGVLPGSLYAAFGDKHALFVRALERYADDSRAGAASLAEDGPVLPRLRELLLSALTAARDEPGRGCMLGNTATEVLPEDDDAARIVSAAFRDLETTIERALAVAQSRGEVRADVDRGAQARLLVAVLQGLHVVARAEPDPRRLQDAVDAALAPLAADLSRRPAPRG